MKWGVRDYSSLIRASDLLSNEIKKRIGLLIPVDIFIQNPCIERVASGETMSEVFVARDMDIFDGPTTSRIAVVDYNADMDKLVPPVTWDKKRACFTFRDEDGKNIPLTRRHKNRMEFHQVHVWAVIQSILSMFEETFVLGRSAPWGFDGNRLIVVPHAGYMANAFYDRRSKSIQLYYTGPEKKRIYTCLDHDIIAHETGHAILDGLRPYYLEDSSLQTTAFHEFIADLTAILASIRNNNLRHIMVEQTKGDFTKASVVTDLAEGFSKYAMGKNFLRTALAKETIEKVANSSSPYDWSTVLTGAMWDILSGMVENRKKVLIEEKEKSRSVKTLLWWAVRHFQRMAFQPLDYLPPIDVQFSDYARAVIRADKVAYPNDTKGYRKIITDVFKARGIPFEGNDDEEIKGLRFYAYDIDQLSLSRTNAYHFINNNRRQLCIPENYDITVAELYRTNKTLPDGSKLPCEIILQYVWSEDVPLEGSIYGPINGQKARLLCGGTLVFDDVGNVLSWIRKPGTGRQEDNKVRLRDHCTDEIEKGQQRVEMLKNYIADRVDAGYIGLYKGSSMNEISSRLPVVAEQGSDGNLHMEVTPYLRHWKKE